MLSDFHPKGKVTKLYGTYNEEYGRGFRSVFLIDTGGIIRHKQIYNPGLPDLEEVLAQLKEMS